MICLKIIIIKVNENIFWKGKSISKVERFNDITQKNWSTEKCLTDGLMKYYTTCFTTTSKYSTSCFTTTFQHFSISFTANFQNPTIHFATIFQHSTTRYTKTSQHSINCFTTIFQHFTARFSIHQNIFHISSSNLRTTSFRMKGKVCHSFMKCMPQSYGYFYL